MVAVAVAGAMLSAWLAPLSAQAHCGDRSEVAEHHHTGPAHHSNNSDRDGLPTSGCPHCSPAECISQPACSTSVVGIAPTVLKLPQPIASLLLHDSTGFMIAVSGPEPPTPPPQARLRHPST